MTYGTVQSETWRTVFRRNLFPPSSGPATSVTSSPEQHNADSEIEQVRAHRVRCLWELRSFCDGTPFCDGTQICDGTPFCDSTQFCDGAPFFDGAPFCDGTPLCDGTPFCDGAPFCGL